MTEETAIRLSEDTLRIAHEVLHSYWDNARDTPEMYYSLLVDLGVVDEDASLDEVEKKFEEAAEELDPSSQPHRDMMSEEEVMETFDTIYDLLHREGFNVSPVSTGGVEVGWNATVPGSSMPEMLEWRITVTTNVTED